MENLSLFSDEEINLFRVTLRESIENIPNQSKELFAVRDYVKDQVSIWDPKDIIFVENLQKFIAQYDSKVHSNLSTCQSRF